MQKRYFFSMLVFFYVFQLFGQGKQIQKDSIAIDTNTTKSNKLNILPVLFFLPQTGLGFGGLALNTFRFKGESEKSRPSSAQLNVSLTTRNQVLIFAPYELYWDDEKWRLFGELGYFKFFYNFYGLGINSAVEDFETYDVNFPRFRTSLLREVFPNFSVGLGYSLDIYDNLQILENGLLDGSGIPGTVDGGTVSNLGLRVFYDSRDNIFLPTSGFFIQANAFTSSSFLGSSFNYSKLNLDARYYTKIKGNHTLAFNGFIGSNSSGTPLFELNFIGADKRTRGFNDRRFQDLNELSLVTEYRFPIKWRIAGVAFASTSTVSSDFGDLFKNRYRNAGGIGLRYLLNQKDGIRIRADYGRSSEGGNFYFTIREAF